MTTPPLPGHRFADCRCGHPKTTHDNPDFRPQCIAPACSCLQYRPATAGQALIPPTNPRPAMTAVAHAPARPMQPAPIRPEPPIAVRDQRSPTLEQVLAAGKRSDFKRTVQLTEKIAVMIHDLRGRLQDEREAAEQARIDEAARDEARKKVAELEAALAEARSILRGSKASGTSPGAMTAISGEPMPCTEPGCDRTFTRAQGLAMHRYRAHGKRASA